MAKTRIIAALAILGVAVACCKHVNADANEQPDQTYTLYENGSTALICKVITPAIDQYDVDQVSVYLRDKKTNEEKLLFTTTNEGYWHPEDYEKNEFSKASIDSIPAVDRAYPYSFDNSRYIVEGCPDCRNIYTYLIDVNTREAWHVPSTSGYMGETEEGYMVFQSYSYVSDPEIAGRYTLIKVFDQDGVMVDSLDLEHVILDKYKDIDNEQR